MIARKIKRRGYSAARKKSRNAVHRQKISSPSKKPMLTMYQLTQMGIRMRATRRSLTERKKKARCGISLCFDELTKNEAKKTVLRISEDKAG